MIGISVYRPFRKLKTTKFKILTLTGSDLLITEPVVFFFSLWVSFSWAVLYLTFGAIPLVFSVSYGFDLQQTSSVFAAMSVGAIISTVLSIYQEGLLENFLAKSTSTSRFFTRLRTPSPEGRLYFACIESALLPGSDGLSLAIFLG
jgi:hypothetical protein